MSPPFSDCPVNSACGPRTVSVPWGLVGMQILSWSQSSSLRASGLQELTLFYQVYALFCICDAIYSFFPSPNNFFFFYHYYPLSYFFPLKGLPEKIITFCASQIMFCSNSDWFYFFKIDWEVIHGHNPVSGYSFEWESSCPAWELEASGKARRAVSLLPHPCGCRQRNLPHRAAGQIRGEKPSEMLETDPSFTFMYSTVPAAL